MGLRCSSLQQIFQALQLGLVQVHKSRNNCLGKIGRASVYSEYRKWYLLSSTVILKNLAYRGAVLKLFSYQQILKPSEKKAKYQYSGLNQNRPNPPNRQQRPQQKK